MTVGTFPNLDGARRARARIMSDRCTIIRLAVRVLDESTGKLVSRDTEVYPGVYVDADRPGRCIVTVDGEGVATVSIPWDAPEPKVGDLVTVVESRDALLAGTDFKIDGVERTSLLTARTFTARTVFPVSP